MNILVIGSRVPFPLRDGGAIATFNMLKGLSELGHQITYFSINTKKHFVDEKTIKNQFNFLKEIITFEINTDFNFLKALKSVILNESYNLKRFFDVQMQKQLIELIKNNQFDCIHFEGLYVAEYVTEIKKHCKVPLILRQHNVEFRIWETLSSESSSLIKKTVYQYLASRIKSFELNILKAFDAVVCIATSDEQILKSLGIKTKINTISAGIEMPKTNPNTVINYQNVFHIGSMEWMPNQQAMYWFLDHIWPLVVEKQTDAQFFMAGKNMPEHFKSYENKNVKVIGEVSDFNEFIKQQSVLVVPLLSASGIRIKTIEGMLNGKAIVSTSIGAKGLDIKNRVQALIADTNADFANAIIELLENKNTRNSIANSGLEYAKSHFENENVCQKWSDFYKKLIIN